MKLVISGGGTGGHIYPALTIAREVLKLDNSCEILFIGTKAGLEADIIPKEGFNFATVNVQGLERKLSVKNVRTIFNAAGGVFQSLRLLRAFRPDVAVGTGGFVCGPVLLAASLLRIPALIQEQNAIPGVTNKILAKFVDQIAVGYEDAKQYFGGQKAKVIVTGNPVREDVLTAVRDAGASSLGLDKNKRTVFVSGGSRGARSINKAMVRLYKNFVGNDEFQILHITGQSEYNNIIDEVKQAGIDLAKNGNIIIKPYLYNMPEAYAAADLAVFRAGAVALAELTLRGVPAILVPYPYAAENHQEFNAKVMEKHGAAVVIKDSELNGEILLQTIRELLSDTDKLKKMSEETHKLAYPQAAQELAKLVLALGRH